MGFLCQQFVLHFSVSKTKQSGICLNSVHQTCQSDYLFLGGMNIIALRDGSIYKGGDELEKDSIEFLTLFTHEGKKR